MKSVPKVNTLYVYRGDKFMKEYFIIREIKDTEIAVDIFNPEGQILTTKIANGGWGNIRHTFRKVKDVKIKTKIGLKGLI